VQPTHRHHAETYGEDFSYDEFAPLFNEAIEAWDPDDWAALFDKVGARYVVLTSRHCESFALWPTSHPCPQKGNYRANRDIVGELAAAVRDHGMRMGLYYCGGMDWVFSERPVTDFPSVYSTMPQEPEYVDYINTHWRELIDRYEPSVMWNDIGYPAAGNVPELMAYYYNAVPDGVINDRFGQVYPDQPPGADDVIGPTASEHSDFTTPEYTSYGDIQEKKWESCRGIGHSFGYNRNEGPEDHLSVQELVRLFVDIVSKNGNLLLNVGPMADGTIPELQRERLEGLGAWLEVNGEAIFGTRPWVRAEGSTVEGVSVRYTRKGKALYAILVDSLPTNRINIRGLQASEGAKVRLLGHDDDVLGWEQDGASLAVSLPEGIGEAPAYALEITPQPRAIDALA
jgi:alpha-L-fucosidase